MYKIYYRKSLMDKEELKAASKYFNCVDLLSGIEEGDFIIPRYSLYPFQADQEREILSRGAISINIYQQHLYIADLQNYAYNLGDLTPETWYRLEDIPDNTEFILKGETNSKKSNWNKNMFASNKKEAGEVYSRLCDDALIGQQKIYIRKYHPLVTYAIGIGGVPITKEFRFFIAYGQVLTGAYYWQNYVDDLENVPSVDEVPQSLLQDVIDRVGDRSNFYVVDVAQTQEGSWIVIELNDGSSSGLSCNDPEILYRRLREVLDKNVVNR